MHALQPRPDRPAAPRLLIVCRQTHCADDAVIAALALAAQTSERHRDDPQMLLWRVHYETYRAWWAAGHPVQVLEGNGRNLIALAERSLLPVAHHGGVTLVGPAPPDRLEPVLLALLA